VTGEREGDMKSSGAGLELDGEAVCFIPVEDTGGTHRVTVGRPGYISGNARPAVEELASVAPCVHNLSPE
jgi:hypothetical protein